MREKLHLLLSKLNQRKIVCTLSQGSGSWHSSDHSCRKELRSVARGPEEAEKLQDNRPATNIRKPATAAEDDEEGATAAVRDQIERRQRSGRSDERWSRQSCRRAKKNSGWRFERRRRANGWKETT